VTGRASPERGLWIFEGDPAAQHWQSAPKAAQAAFQSIEANMNAGIARVAV
jgi:hypothetical protein